MVGHLFLSKATFQFFVLKVFFNKPFDHSLLLVNWNTPLRTADSTAIVLIPCVAAQN